MLLLDGPTLLTSTPPAVHTGDRPVRLDMHFYYVGDHTWATMLGQSVRLQPVPIQSLSELERARLQEVALYHLEERDLDVKISIPREIRKRRKSLRRKFDSFSKEKKERESAPKAFGIPLSQVIANDRAYKLRQDALKESRRDCLDLEASILRFRAEKRQFFNGNKPLVGSSSITGGGGPGSPSANSVAPAPIFENQNKPLSPTFLDNTGRGQRRGGLSVDSISDLVESQSRLLEALQLSHPAELELKKAAGGGSSEGRTQNKLSLNPIYRQVPRVMERCCSHIETHGLQTVGIFRVGSSKKRVRQLREDFDVGVDVQLDEEHSVHDVAALLKEFLRDIPDPLLPRELYPAFLHANLLRGADQLQYLQHLLYLLPPCNCDTLLRLLTLLHTVQSFAQDSIGTNDEEIPGNKMTAANLAVIFGPNLLQRERGGDVSLQAMGIEDSTAIISVTLVLIQNYRRLFTVTAEVQQEVLMSLIQTDPDIIDYLLRRKLSSSNLTVESSSESGGRRDTGASLDSVGASSGSLSPLEPPSPLFPPDGSGGEGSLTSEVFLNVLKLNQNRKRQETRYGEVPPGKSIRHMRQFHSHHNLLSLSQPSSSSCSTSRLHGQDPDPQDRRGPLGSALSFSLGVGGGSCSSLSGSTESSIWVRQTPQEESKPSPATNFWDFFTGKGSSSETMV
ncbi:rho GTPase-activating protein 6-like isoform X1 [Seriola lalandi dorsalis]|uniref:rho GTPase-activating protein 6-like isoform X1 n=2 Tax=Seriola lalandi dorsalis TaxID=1841481 RepID=UPI000C6F8318|nr:rho GTPase-activating protein 6-like isoform X1 [Seriola lalandi dorsalis]XP_056225731.1 rho GTPase-activating protein 36 isoform X1 [Seriola aureovittata]